MSAGIVISQKLAQAAFELVQRRHQAGTRKDTPRELHADADYLHPARSFPAMLHYNGPVVALEMLDKKTATWPTVPKYKADIEALLGRIRNREPFEKWRASLPNGATASGKTLGFDIKTASVSDYLLFQHHLAQAATWLKHYAELTWSTDDAKPARNGAARAP